MKVSELLEILQVYVKRHPEMLDREVVIETDKGGILYNHMSQISNASPGFDWTAPLFILRANEGLLPVKTLQIPVRKAGEDRLKQIEEAYSKSSFNYGVKKSQRSVWVDGFCEGVMMYVTDVDKPESAKIIRKRLGWDELTEEQQEYNIAHNFKD